MTSRGLEIPLETNWEIEVKFSTQFGSKCIACDVLNFIFFPGIGGKMMRIDYFIISEQLKDCIIACEMQGHIIELKGTIYFMMCSFHITCIYLKLVLECVMDVMKIFFLSK